MSEAEQFTDLVNLVEIDPFALVGVSVSADEKRIAKRYRQIAKQLHPDALAASGASGEMLAAIASKIIARIVNPSYQKLKHERSRQETLSSIRLRVRRLVRTEKLVPTFPSAQQLSKVADENVDIFYEQALTHIANSQFQSLEQLHTHSLEISQLNLVFLSRRLENLVIRPKRTGLMTTAVTPTAAASVPSAVSSPSGHGAEASAQTSKDESPEIDYVQKHVARAKAYLAKASYEMAVQELREALKIASRDPELHSMIGQAYYKQKLSGMAKSHFRQALKLKPTHKVALKYSKLLGMAVEADVRRSDPRGTGIPSTESASTKNASTQNTSTKSASAADASKRAWLNRLLSR